MRSTLRRKALTTPASVHCMSRQHIVSDLSCTGFRRKSWHPRHPPHHLALDHVLLLELLDLDSPGTSGSGFSRVTGSDPAGNPPTDSGIASIMFLLVSFRRCARCSLCTQLYNVLRISQLLLDPSIHLLCNIRTFVEHITFVTIQHSDSTLCCVFSNRQQWFCTPVLEHLEF